MRERLVGLKLKLQRDLIIITKETGEPSDRAPTARRAWQPPFLCSSDHSRAGPSSSGLRRGAGRAIPLARLEHFPVQLNRRGIPESAWF